MDFQAISFSANNTNSRNRVKESTEQFYDSLGFSKLLFNSENATTLQFSVVLDESKLYSLNRQLETWVTRKFQYNFKGNFKCQFLDVTHRNKKEVAEDYLKGATYGVPSVIHYAACLGINQVDLMSLNYLQNDVLDMSTKFIPLSSSNTQSGMAGDDKGGRPTKDNTTSDSTVANRENGTDEEKKASDA